jgi:hypothetical protein
VTTEAPPKRSSVDHRTPLLVLVVVLIGSIAGVMMGAWAAGFLHLPSSRHAVSSQAPPPLLRKATFPRLAASYATATRAGSVVVGAVAPAGGPVEVFVIPSNGVSAPVDHMRIRVTRGGHTETPQLTACGTWCYRLSATVFHGSTTRIAVQVGTPTRATLALPARMPPDASAVYRKAVRRMTSVQAVEATQTLSSGGPPTIMRYTAEAPDRLRYTTSTGLHTVLIGRRRWDLHAGDWVECPSGGEHAPSYVWQGATAARLAGQRVVNGLQIDTVSVFNPFVPAWFVLDTTANGTALDVHMLAPSHFMHETYRLAQNATVTAPPRFRSGAKTGAC